jgi:hypoxanthine phosphoribosyltransferase
MTTGTTMQSCLRLLKNVLEETNTKLNVCDKIESVKELLHAIVITTVPKTSVR